MQKGPQIDYVAYGKAMRAGLSGEEICMEDSTLNHQYFHSKKGFYWSVDNEIRLGEGLRKFGLDPTAISRESFGNQKTEIEIELRICLLFGVREICQLTANDLDQFFIEVDKIQAEDKIASKK